MPSHFPDTQQIMGKRGDLNELSDPSSQHLGSVEELHNAAQSNGRLHTAGGLSTDRSPGLVQYNNWYAAKQIGSGLGAPASHHKHGQSFGADAEGRHARTGASECTLNRDDARRTQQEPTHLRLQQTLQSQEKAKDELQRR